MKWEQVNQALEFLDDRIESNPDRVNQVILQCEYHSDIKHIMRYLGGKTGTIIHHETDNCMLYGRNGRIMVISLTADHRVAGHRMEDLFFIERISNDYQDGDIIKERTDTGRELPSSPFASRTSVSIRPKETSYLAIRYHYTDPITDPSTLVIQYDDPSLKHEIQSLVRGYKRKNAESFLDSLTSIDIFIDIDLSKTSVPWKRIAYECLKNNPNPGARFSGAMFVRVSRTFTKPTHTLNMLLEGVK